ncbi:GcrA family cell cycle regulator [Rhizobium sp. NLR22b]|uniref:GcrA family cell cycle regulator n=1 Tax=Rhizobium sp. NLR22b TaxID=2731115 RepID=UPI001C82BEBE|nr:GcrA family cell cycle regulator [Rhizobium sp. NLR22b]MBX5238648.1 GcrA cell cycle regulator [Rhizobium sp. NLR22b]
MTDVFWTEERIAKAEKLWSEGLSARAIADIVGSKKNTVINMAFRHRDRFPARQGPRRRGPYTPTKPTHYPDRVTRITTSGASVTMPRVPTIDGPAPIILQIATGEEIQ